MSTNTDTPGGTTTIWQDFTGLIANVVTLPFDLIGESAKLFTSEDFNPSNLWGNSTPSSSPIASDTALTPPKLGTGKFINTAETINSGAPAGARQSMF